MPDLTNRKQVLLLTLVMGLMTAVGPFTIDMYLPAMPEMQAEFRSSDTQIQLTMTGTMIGFALGQLLIGPLSDAYGRRRPLQIGILLHAAACLLSLLADDIVAISALRILQGLGAAACGTIAMAMVRDLFDGQRAAKMFSRLMLILSVSPILAPTVGGLIAEDFSWRYIFAALAVVSLGVGAMVTFLLPESLPVDKRQPAKLGVVLRNFGTLVSDRVFFGLVLVASCGSVGLFFYISGSSFILQSYYGLTPRTFGIVFASMAIGLIGATQFNVALLNWTTPGRILVAGIGLAMLGSGTMSALLLLGVDHLAVVLGGLFLTLAGFGFMIPNVPALALMRYPTMAGSAAAMQGMMQNLLAAAAGPVVGLIGLDTPVPMATLMFAAFTVAAILVIFVVRRSGLRQPVGVFLDENATPIGH